MDRKTKEDLVAKFDYYATESHELTILKGEHLKLLDDSLQWWQVVNCHGEVGYVPSNYVRPAKQVSQIMKFSHERQWRPYWKTYETH